MLYLLNCFFVKIIICGFVIFINTIYNPKSIYNVHNLLFDDFLMYLNLLCSVFDAATAVMIGTNKPILNLDPNLKICARYKA